MLVVNIGAYYESLTKSIAFLGICLEMSSTNLKHQVIEICNTNSMLICTIVSKHHSFYLNFVIKAVAWTVFPELDTLAYTDIENFPFWDSFWDSWISTKLAYPHRQNGGTLGVGASWSFV